jgi:hypothetical protein
MPTSPRHSLPRLALVLIAAAPACFHPRPHRPPSTIPGQIESGRAFDLERAQQVKIGMGEAEVVELMGPPHQEFLDDQGGRWISWHHQKGHVFRVDVKMLAARITDGKVDNVNRNF